MRNSASSTHRGASRSERKERSAVKARHTGATTHSSVRRIVLKLSGELFSGRGRAPFSLEKTEELAQELARGSRIVEMGIVLGGGNIWRGRHDARGVFDSTLSDYMGMVATFVNALALKGALKQQGVRAHIIAPFFIPGVVHPLCRSTVRPSERRKGMRRLLSRKEVLLFSAGTGKPGVTTDSVTVSRALEIGAEAVLKGTKVDGVYSRDPKRFSNARRYPFLSYAQYIKKRFGVMDVRAIREAQEGGIPVFVFRWKKRSLEAVLHGRGVFTRIGD